MNDKEVTESEYRDIENEYDDVENAQSVTYSDCVEVDKNENVYSVLNSLTLDAKPKL